MPRFPTLPLFKISGRESDKSVFGVGAACTLLLMPSLYALLTFQTVPDFQLTLRSLAIPVRVAEAVIVLIAMADGFSLAESWRRLDRFTRFAAVLWLASVVVAAAFAPFDRAVAIALALGTLLHGVTALALFDRLRERECAADLIIAGSWGLAGYAILAAVCAVLLSHVAGFPWYYFGVGVSNVRQIGFYGLPVFGAALGLIAGGGPDGRRIMPVILLIAGIFLVCWSGGRAALAAAIVALLASLAIAEPRARWRVIAMVVVAVAVVFPVVQALSFDPLWGFDSLRRVVPEAGVRGMDEYSSSRLQLWRWTLQAIVAQPWLGHGEGQFSTMIFARSGVFYNHPHNVVLQILYEWGIPGLAAIAALVGRVLWPLRSLGRSACTANAPAACGFMGLAAMSVLEGALYHPLPILFALLFLAAIATGSPQRATGVSVQGGSSSNS